MVRNMIAAATLALTTPPLNAATFALAVTDEHTGAPLEGVVVTVASQLPGKPTTTEIVQQDRRFIPHVTVVPAGSPIDFPNRDNTQHHVYSFSPAKPFNIELYAGRPEAPVVFDKPGIVELGCNIHDHMKAFVVVTDQARHGVTDEAGRVNLKVEEDVGFPLTFELWHPRMPDNTRAEQHTVRSGESMQLNLQVRAETPPASPLDRLQQRFRDLE